MSKFNNNLLLSALLLSLPLSLQCSFTRHYDHETTRFMKENPKAYQDALDFVRAKQNLHVASWQMYYTAIPTLIKKYNLKKGAEVGVAFGTHSERILQTTSVETLYSVDPYFHFSTSYDDGMNLPQKSFDILYYQVVERLSPFSDRSIILRMMSTDAAKRFDDLELDFVFIDANHSYEGVKADLEAWWDKVRWGGIVAGDDYDHPAFPGVKRAVDEFFRSKGLTITIDTTTNYRHLWYLQKN